MQIENESSSTSEVLRLRDKVLFAFGVPFVSVLAFANQFLPQVANPGQLLSPSDWFTAIASVILQLLILGFGVRLLKLGHLQVLRGFLVPFLVYIVLSCAGEVVYLTSYLASGVRPQTPSPADLFWWMGYIALISGCLFVTVKFRKVRVPFKITLALVLWTVISAIFLIALQNSMQAKRPLKPVELWAYLSYPVIDVLLAGLAIALFRICSAIRLTYYWLLLLAGILATCVGDILFAMGGVHGGTAAGLADSFFVLSYALYLLGVMTAFRLEAPRAQLGGGEYERMGITDSIQAGLAKGSIRTYYVVIFAGTFLLIEKGIEGLVHRVLPFGAFFTFLISFAVAFALRGLFRPLEFRQDVCRHYGKAFKKLVLMDVEESAADILALQKSRQILGIQESEARAIERRLLSDKLAEQSAREELLRLQELEAVPDQHWAEWRNKAIILMRQREVSLREKEILSTPRNSQVLVTRVG